MEALQNSQLSRLSMSFHKINKPGKESPTDNVWQALAMALSSRRR